ncbi:MAG: hypothetical protein K1X71_03735 [Pirellulales bacterium]|nr:hypothetical protein [Pirellulales bacterium]
MANTKRLELGGSTKQWLLVAGLAIVLIGVLMFNRHTLPNEEGSAPEPSAPVAKSVASSKDKQQSTRRSWPVVSLEEALAYDPFAEQQIAQSSANDQSQMAKVAAGPVPGQSVETNEEESDLLNERVQSVVSGGQGAAAVVGDRIVRVGDIIDGFEVVTIDKGGVRLRRAAGQ